jgi:hypothetical protein
MALDQVTYILIFEGHMICHKSRFTNKKYIAETTFFRDLRNVVSQYVLIR